MRFLTDFLIDIIFLCSVMMFVVGWRIENLLLLGASILSMWLIIVLKLYIGMR